MNENKITVDLSNLSEDERKQLLTLIEKANKPKTTVWKPVNREKYYSIDSTGSLYHIRWEDDNYDLKRFKIGNCFKTEDEANFAVERLKVIAELKRFANEHNPANFDRNVYGLDKWYLYYDQSDKHVHAAYNKYGLNSEAIFANSDVTKAAIEKIGEDSLKKYYFGIS